MNQFFRKYFVDVLGVRVLVMQEDDCGLGTSAQRIEGDVTFAVLRYLMEQLFFIRWHDEYFLFNAFKRCFFFAAFYKVGIQKES